MTRIVLAAALSIVTALPTIAQDAPLPPANLGAGAAPFNENASQRFRF
ncbi:MAG: hypothetical protein JO254_05860, partial [Pseudolabrys sp.]|nr:hypothetical protein [Pseudolabrys sp.]